MRGLWRGGMVGLMVGPVVGLGLLLAAGPGQAQVWPLHVGPGLDAANNAMAEFDLLRRGAPIQAQPPVVPLRATLPAVPAWTPPPVQQPRIRRAAAPRPANREVAQTAPAPAAAPATEPPARSPDIEAAERRLAERERLLRDLQRDVEEERRLVNERRGSQRAAR
ncbi:hypothetical protein [Paracraurococcus lichenis]|uniref:Uncharacterized protein n=1 Tax=Paracraurococcus lichenis TaxID=3064888 RepID=A0ABT9DWI4_9PROT|nr:hypothetical protein [Paracraurococcus sp. LOR1-02]MDO9708261.1 hypothetical protein [Paracraurococcus sp. LOR1-02]